MKAIITVEVPEHQIGQEVSVYFKDTMCVKSVCTPLTFLKYRMKDYVFYKVDWLKEHWEKEMELLGVDFSKHDEDIIKETVASIWGKPCADAVSRQAVDELSKELVHTTRDKADFLCNFWERLQKLPSAYPQNTDVLDKIKAEIERYQADCNLSCSDDANCRICDKITFDTIYRIIDKYRKGQTNEDSD